MSRVGSLRGVQAIPEPCNSNSNSNSMTKAACHELGSQAHCKVLLQHISAHSHISLFVECQATLVHTMICHHISAF
jgi:hypothetical protein